jgi:hypothetical protein
LLALAYAGLQRDAATISFFLLVSPENHIIIVKRFKKRFVASLVTSPLILKHSSKTATSQTQETEWIIHPFGPHTSKGYLAHSPELPALQRQTTSETSQPPLLEISSLICSPTSIIMKSAMLAFAWLHGRFFLVYTSARSKYVSEWLTSQFSIRPLTTRRSVKPRLPTCCARLPSRKVEVVLP